jgi:hypothetical protein
MALPQSPFALLLVHQRRMVRGSRIRLGKNVRVQGVPAILMGVACIVAAAGAASVLRKAAPILPDTLREARELWKTIRADRRELNP